MSTLYLANSFSLGMIPSDDLYILEVSPMELGGVKGHLRHWNFVSIVGHESTAKFISAVTGVDVPVNREAITMSPGDMAIILQLGARLPEGKVLSSSELETIPHKWFKVVLREAT